MNQQPAGAKQWWQLPFDLYDIFGYLFPGVVFWLAVGTLLKVVPTSEEMPLAIGVALDTLSSSTSWWSGIIVIFFLVVVLYATGHLVATLGVVTLDGMLFSGVLGRPFQWLLGFPDKVDPVGRATYQYLVVIGNAWLLAVLFGLAQGHEFLVSAGFVMLGILVCLPKVIEIARGTDALDDVESEDRWWKFRWLAERVLMLPLRIFVRLAQTRREYPKSLRQRISADFARAFEDLRIDEVKAHGFWLTYHSIVQRSPAHAKVIMNFVHMFSFARNLSIALFLPIMIASIAEVMSIGFFSGFNRNVAWPLLISAWLMGWRFCYLFAKYYTGYTFLAFVALNDQDRITSIKASTIENPPGASQGTGG